MLEHVGKYHYTRFFDKIAEFLTDVGFALIHSMVEEEELSPDAWIDRYIFPGGYIPTVSEVVEGIERSDCQLVTVFTHEKGNYFKTLECWKSNLFGNRQQCEKVMTDSGVALDDLRTVIRIWEYFLSASQIAFSPRYGRCRVVHFVVRRKV
jgi:cyclopropane-fatty-acyl-phospholipid synthase